MTDPFEALREPITPIDPDPAFASQLRDRVESALRTKGDLPTTEPLSSAASPEVMRIGLALGLVVSDKVRGLEWYERALGARRLYEPIDLGGYVPAWVELGGAVLYLTDQSEQPQATQGKTKLPFRPPRPGDNVPSFLILRVGDVDAAAQRAVSEGATLLRGPEDAPPGRSAVIRDPFGHVWDLTEALAHQTVLDRSTRPRSEWDSLGDGVDTKPES